MNITKLITSLQKAANTSTTAAELANLSRAVKGLNVGTVQTVANLASLPAMLSTNGNLYYVESEQDLYFNVGATWDLFYNIENIDYAWGRNNFGQLGDNTTSDRSSPVTVLGSITNWTQVSSGGYHNLGLTSTGIAYAWGINSDGRLGDNTTSSRLSPVTVVGGITTWSQLSAGGNHSLGLTSNGIIYSWGRNLEGMLGDGTTTSRSSPVTVIGGITSWSKISAGRYHSAAVTSGGIAYAWGYNLYGQLGDDTLGNRSSPVTVVGGITNWATVNASWSISLGITNTGIAYAWGRNQYGQLGDNTTSSRTSPVTVVGGITSWSPVFPTSSGGFHTVGLTTGGVAYAWGRNTWGQLGDDTTSNRSSPVTVVGGFTNWSQIDAGWNFTIGLTGAGAVYAWGRNNYGQLGDNTTSTRTSPVTVVGGLTSWNQISVGFYHSVALATTYVP